jgi:DNA primase
MMKNEGLIDEIKSRIDIQELIAEYVDLKRAGSNFKGLCPFHSEKTPSFIVNPARQIFHCFGCNKGGDIFSFMMDYENMTFSEALENLAARAGVKIEKSAGNDPNRGIKDGLYAINSEASRFFSKNLQGSNQALSYLKNRGITDESISQFSIGFAGPERDELMRLLRSAGFSENLMKTSGLVYFGDSGAHDFFRERIMFPIFDLKGKIIAFGGRTLSSSKDVPKFLNSPENPLFKKSETCYALNLARNSIAQKGYSIIVEGYFDAIICHQYGFINTAAPMGTALTANHLRRLKKITSKTVLTFDADNAGIAAARRAVELVYAEGMISKIALLDKGDDPDSFLRKHGADDFRKLIGRAISPVQFFLSKTGKNKVAELRHFLAMLSACPDILLRDDTLRELSDLASEKALRDELKLLAAKSGFRLHGGDTSGSSNNNIAAPQKICREEDILINISLSNPDMARRIAKNLDISGLESPLSVKIFNTILSAPDTEKLTCDKILGECSPEECSAINKSSVDPGIDVERVAQNINECLKKIALRSLSLRISAAKNSGDENALRQLLLEKKSLTQKNIELFPAKDSK